jgi:hypothetical protein
MFDPAAATTPGTTLARLRGAIDDLQSLDLSCATDEEVLDLLRELESQKRRLASVDHATIGEIDHRRLAGERACRDTTTLVSLLLRVDHREAAGRVRAAAELGPRRTLTGEALPPIFQATAEACATGTISTRHATVITETVCKLPDAIQAEMDRTIEAILLEHAHQLDPTQLRGFALRLRDAVDQDGTLVQERERQRRRQFTVTQRPDGSSSVHGELTAVATEALLTVLDTLARPAPSADGQRDPRNAAQRRHDALQDAALMLIRTGELPACGGVAATILLTMTPDQLQSGNGSVASGHGATISAGLALSLLGDAQIMPIVVSRTRQISAYGDSHRIFTQQQRLAMTARDRGCSFPGCTAPPAWCQAHHITDYAITRRTRIDDGTLLCGYHHREHSRLGWTCRVIDGIPHWTAPTWLDPDQTPQRNRTHHPALV